MINLYSTIISEFGYHLIASDVYIVEILLMEEVLGGGGGGVVSILAECFWTNRNESKALDGVKEQRTRGKFLFLVRPIKLQSSSLRYLCDSVVEPKDITLANY